MQDEHPWLDISAVQGFDMDAARRFAVRSLPYNVVVGRDGTILAKNVHGEELEALIESTLS